MGTDRTRLAIALLAVVAITIHLGLRFGIQTVDPWLQAPLWVALLLGGVPLVGELVAKAFRKEFGSDLLAGLSIVTSVLLGEYLAGTLVVLMLSGGEALEEYAVRRASSVLEALARRMPSVAHRRGAGDVPLESLEVGDILEVFPHEICPVDGVVLEGHGVMDESYLTGEPFMMSKTPGSEVLSGSVNGEASLVIRALRKPVDSRYARIMEVMQATEMSRPRLRRLGDQLGAWYTPLAVGIAVAAWLASGDPIRFLAVLVIATPCPLLIAIPVAIIGSISVSAGRGIIVKDPAVLETVDTCRTVILDKTGTLTYGRPQLTTETMLGDVDPDTALRLAASLERYSKHPLAVALLARAKERGLPLVEADSIREAAGEGLTGQVEGRTVQITSRARVASDTLPPASGLECVVLVDGRPAAHYRFHDEPRGESRSFVRHLGGKHGIGKVMIVSGDRESEVRYLARLVGIEEVHAGKSPEEKVEIVRAETAAARTLYVGDGINDAPALVAATVGLALGQHSDVTAEAAGAVVMDSDIARVDEFMHIGRRMRAIALQSALGGMILSIAGMGLAAFGLLSPVAGAVGQEIIDLAAVLNALRAAFPPRSLTDF